MDISAAVTRGADQGDARSGKDLPGALAAATAGCCQLRVRTVPARHAGGLLARLHGPGPLAWTHRGDGLIGLGEAAVISVSAGADRFRVAERALRGLFGAAETEDRVGIPGCGPVAFGSFTFDFARGGSVLVIPRVVLGRRDGVSWVTTIEAVPGGAAAAGGMPPPPAPEPARGGNGLTSAPWERAVAAAVTRIRGGSLRKVVLARSLQVATEEHIDVIGALEVLADRDPDCYVFACAGLIGATPELLIQRAGRQVRSRVIAGTAARDYRPAEDTAASASLLASAKETEEHLYAVESVRQALAPLCDHLIADARPSVICLADTHHLATTISGTLAAPASALTLAGLLHPTAAVCGTPPGAAMDTIRELEHMDRGRYAGPVGWMDARGDGEWGLALHCGEVDGSRARLFAGCGIVAGSDPAAEAAEAEAKFQPMLRALGLRPGPVGTGPAATTVPPQHLSRPASLSRLRCDRSLREGVSRWGADATQALSAAGFAVLHRVRAQAYAEATRFQPAHKITKVTAGMRSGTSRVIAMPGGPRSVS